MQLRNKKNNSQYSDSCNKVFSYWRFRTMYSIVMGYAAFYLIRQNFSLAVPAMCSNLHYTKSDIGIVMSIAAALYGFGKCFFGVVGDRYSARYIMSFGLLFSAFMNICMGFSSIIPVFAVFWSLNYCFQSMGYPPCAKLLTHWFSPVEIGTKWAVWNTSQQMGSAVIAFTAPVILMYFGWRYIFLIPGVIAILMAILLFNRLRDTPESLKLPSVEKMTGLASVAESSKWAPENDTRLSYFETLKMVLSNKFVWFVGLANFFVYICRMTFLNWGPTFLLESKGSSLTSAGFQMVAFDLAGMCGGVFAGYLSDKVFNGRRGPVSSLYMLIVALLVTLLWLSPKDSPLLSSVCMLCVGFLITGPQILIGVAATDFSAKKIAATASGFTGTLGYVGTAVAGFGTGYLADKYGWEAVFCAIVGSAIVSAIFLVLTWNKRSEILNKASDRVPLE
ncbi:MAG: MFS transporter [Holosporales bacterium]|jgi:phosphoglycerate transporter family protein|nr:MFS transporter [Holosporales bacterium]